MFRLILFFLFLPFFSFSQSGFYISVDSANVLHCHVNGKYSGNLVKQIVGASNWYDEGTRKISKEDTILDYSGTLGPSMVRFELEIDSSSHKMLFSNSLFWQSSDFPENNCFGFKPGDDADGNIHFKCKQEWKILDIYGVCVQKGNCQDIDISSLDSGHYSVYFCDKYLNIISNNHQKKSDHFQKELSIDTNGRISICLSDSANETVYLECYRWNKWVMMDTIQRKISDNDTCIYSPIENYDVEEQYRLAYIFHDGTVVHSHILKYTHAYNCGGIENHCWSDKIKLVCPSKWEIYDSYGQMVKAGYGDLIYFDGLPKGGYFLNYSNTTAEFFKQ